MRPLISRNPQRELIRIAGNYRPKKGFLTIILGAAHFQLVDLMCGAGVLLVLDVDTKLLAHVKSLFPQIYTASTDQQIEEFLEDFSIEELAAYRVLKVPGSISLNGKWYLNAEEQIKGGLSSRISDMFTRLEFEPRWVFNALMQLPLLKSSIPISRLFNQYKNKGAAILVSTGPSLRESLPMLKKIALDKSRFFIACVDSAYRVLHRNGIVPDLIITLDAQPHTLRHFQGLPDGPVEDGGKPWLYADLVANPAVTRRWRGVRFFGVTAQYRGQNRIVTPGCEYIESIIEDHLGDIQSGGSVATSAFDLLRRLEFSRIYFVGQDLAYTYREIHSVGTHHSDMWYPITNRVRPIEQINDEILHKRHTKIETGIKGAPVHVDYVLGLYRNWFSDAAKKIPKKVINATANGARIKNISEQKLEEVFFENNTLDEFDLPEVQNFKPIHFDHNNISRLIEVLKKSWSPEFLQEFTFMNWIGRKFQIANLRLGNSHEDLSNQLEGAHKGFWYFVGKKFPNLKI